MQFLTLSFVKCAFYDDTDPLRDKKKQYIIFSIALLLLLLITTIHGFSTNLVFIKTTYLDHRLP